jgi:hypothetical protein
MAKQISLANYWQLSPKEQKRLKDAALQEARANAPIRIEIGIGPVEVFIPNKYKPLDEDRTSTGEVR